MKTKNILLIITIFFIALSMTNAEWSCTEYKDDVQTTEFTPVTKTGFTPVTTSETIDSEEEMRICTMEYAPVCGVDGKTYGNDCMAGDVEIDYEGECVEEELVGSDRDIHGCIGSAGYTWSISKEKCIRVWEEDLLSDNDKSYYLTIQERLETKYQEKVDDVVTIYKEKLNQYSSLEKKQALNEKIISLLEKEISDFLLDYPQDVALPDNANKIYMILTLFKFELMLLEY